MVWLLGSAGAMLVAAIMSLSRSTAVGLCLAAVFVGRRWRCGGRREPRAGSRAAAVGAVTVVLSLPETRRLAERFEKPEFAVDLGPAADLARDAADRPRLRAHRHRLGAFRTAMLVYQKTDRTFFFNQAHNQYLQFATDGGVLLLIPLAFAALAFAATVRRRLRPTRPDVLDPRRSRRRRHRQRWCRACGRPDCACRPTRCCSRRSARLRSTNRGADRGPAR